MNNKKEKSVFFDSDKYKRVYVDVDTYHILTEVKELMRKKSTTRITYSKTIRELGTEWLSSADYEIS